MSLSELLSEHAKDLRREAKRWSTPGGAGFVQGASATRQEGKSLRGHLHAVLDAARIPLGPSGGGFREDR